MEIENEKLISVCVFLDLLRSISRHGEKAFDVLPILLDEEDGVIEIDSKKHENINEVRSDTFCVKEIFERFKNTLMPDETGDIFDFNNFNFYIKTVKRLFKEDKTLRENFISVLPCHNIDVIPELDRFIEDYANNKPTYLTSQGDEVLSNMFYDWYDAKNNCANKNYQTFKC